MNIPTDVSRFGLMHMLAIPFSICIALGLWLCIPPLGLAISIGTASFWIGMACLFVSDTIDNGAIDERDWASQAFNVLGLFVVAFSVVGVLFYVFLYTFVIAVYT